MTSTIMLNFVRNLGIVFSLIALCNVDASTSLMPNVSELKRQKGDQLVVVCNTDAPGITKWYSPNGEVVPDDSSQRVHIERADNKVVLRIKGVRLNDKGHWSCDAGMSGRQSFLLDVEEQVQLITKSEEYAPYGEPFLLTCTSTSSVEPTISWRKGPHKNMIPNNSNYRVDSSGLHIKSVGLAENDTFWCTADIYATGVTVDRPIRVIVSKEVTPPHITCAEEPCAIQGGKAVLRCHSSGIPSPKYRWSKGSSLQIQSNSEFKYHTQGNSLVINRLNLSDSGIYECRAFNEYDTRGKSAEYRLTVLVPPTILPIMPAQVSTGGMANLVCNVDPSSSPEIRFRWTFQNMSVISTNNQVEVIDDIRNYRSILRLHDANKNSFQNYTCEVSNIAGTRRAVGEVRVSFPCEFTARAPTIFYGLDGVEATLTCSFDGYPMPSVTWHFSDASSRELRPGDAGITDITVGQVGPYTWHSNLRIVPSSLANDVVLYCVAQNARDKNIQLRLRRASPPDPPTYGNRVKTFVNTATFKTILPANTGGLPIRQVEVRYKPVPDEKQPITPPFLAERYNVSAGEDSLHVSLSNLLPSTLYRVGLVAYTDYGASRLLENLFRTSGKTVPVVEVGVAPSGNLSAPVILVNSSNDILSCGLFSSCHLRWRVLSDGGSPLKSVTITYHRVRTGSFDSGGKKKTVNLPATDDHYLIKDLLPVSKYIVELKVSNEIGPSVKMFNVKTSTSPPGYRELQEARKRPSVWAVVGIILLIVVLLVLLCMFVVCLRMPKPNTSGNNFIGKIAGVSSPEPSFFNDDLRDCMQPLNGDSARNFNPLYKENTGFESPWNTFVEEPRFDKRTPGRFATNTDSSRV